MNKRTWAARIAVLGLSATVLVGVSTGGASAADESCVPVGRPNGAVTEALEPLIGSPYGPPGSQPLGTIPFLLTGLLDRVVCELTP